MTAAEIIRIRHALGLTQAALAARMGVVTATVSHWEQGLRQCSGSAAVLLAGMAQEARERLRRELEALG